MTERDEKRLLKLVNIAPVTDEVSQEIIELLEKKSKTEELNSHEKNWLAISYKLLSAGKERKNEQTKNN